MAMTEIEKGLFLRLFNRGGYVLNFTTSSFDTFTKSSIGVALCAHYGLSKGRSLTNYIEEESNVCGTKLLCDLFDYYEAQPEYASEMDGTSTARDAKDHHFLYEKCKPIARRERAGISVLAQREELETHFTSDYMRQQIDALFSSRETNPTEAIGKSKELIESCCKTILEENNRDYEGNWGVSQLVKETMKCLGIETDDINADLPAGGTIKRILSSLGNIAGGIAELRNPYGTGHGKADSYKGLTIRHAKLAVGSSATLVEYLWDAHEWRKERQQS